MAAPPPPSTASVLPIDLIAAEILPRLSAKSLLRFKCVCKSFNTVVSSPEFVRHHLRHSISSDNRLVNILTTELPFYTVKTFDLDSLSTSTTATAASATFSWLEHASIVGSCNGLLLFGGGFSGPFSLLLLNPSTRAYVDGFYK
ncbi:hypothetical protein RND81_10G244300 [Saponaria officinalis]|uniref:F-box domain-containing protein n=1 Tax=Saponaria officinalis TaxID=3572 RepID=A0AAW1I7B0_SAPOF